MNASAAIGITPHSKEAEASFLASCLMDENAVDIGLDLEIKPEDFFISAHSDIWKVMTSLKNNRKVVDMVTVSDALQGCASIQFPSTFIADLSRANAGLSYNAKDYAQIVHDKASRRALLTATQQIAGLAYDESRHVDVIFDQAEATFRRVTAKVVDAATDPSPAAVIERMEKTKSTGVPVKFPRLNQITGGLVKGHLWVIGGFSSTGKSAFAVNLLDDVARAGQASVMFSTEMSSEQYMHRMISLTSQIPQRVLKNGAMTLEESTQYKLATDYWKSKKVMIYDSLYTVTKIRRAAKRIKEQQGLDVVFVDFIQNLSETGDEVKDARMAAIQLQAMAKELDVCVVALSQISNAQAMQQNETGAMGNYYAFKGSGAIKDAADVAIMLDRDRVNKPDVLWVNIVKNRHDSIDRLAGWFELSTGTIRPMSIEEQLAADPNSGRRSKQKESTDEVS